MPWRSASYSVTLLVQGVKFIAEFFALWSNEDDSGTCAIGVFGPVEEHGPVLQVREFFLLLCLVPVGEEISKGLRLDGPAGLIIHAVGADFDEPLVMRIQSWIMLILAV
jgi:hypothetical protein